MRLPQVYSGICGPGTFVQTMWKRGMGVLSQLKLPARKACTGGGRRPSQARLKRNNSGVRAPFMAWVSS